MLATVVFGWLVAIWLPDGYMQIECDTYAEAARRNYEVHEAGHRASLIMVNEWLIGHSSPDSHINEDGTRPYWFNDQFIGFGD